MARSGKRKTIGKKSKVPASGSSFRPAGSEVAKPSIGFFRAWAGPAFFAAALFLFLKNKTQFALALGFVGVVFQVTKTYSEQKPTWMIRILRFATPFKGSLVFWMWVAFAAVTLTFPNFSWLFPGIAAHLPFQQSLWVSMILIVGMVGAVRLLPDKGTEADFSPGISRFLLCVFLGVGAVLRFHHADQAMGSYSIDCASDIVLVRHVVDLANYQGLSEIVNDLLPLWLFSAFSLWHLLPDASSLLIQRLTCTTLDLAAIWVLYFAGKEMGGRRMGLIAAALAAVSKPLITFAVSGYPSSAMTFSMSLVLLSTLRLMKKTDILHFLYWGASVGFLGFTFIYFQPYVPFFIFAVLAWLFFQKANGKNPEWPGPLVWATFFTLLTYFLYFLNAFSASSWISWIVDFGGSWIPCLALAVVVICGAIDIPKMSLQGKSSKWGGWAAGAWLAAVLSFSAFTNATIFARIKMHALVGGGGFLSGSYLSAAFQSLTGSFIKIFWGGGDRSDMSLPGDAYLSYPEVILIALGFAFCVAKPSFKRVFVLLTVAVGIALHSFATETHSLRLLGCPPPLLLLGALGLNELLTAFSNLNQKRNFNILIFILLAGFWVWSAQGVYARVHEQWAQKPMDHVVVRNQAVLDLAQGYRVYLASNLADGSLTVLYEGHPVHLWRNTNLVELGSDENGPDIVIFMRPDEISKQQLTQAFPKSTWSELRNSDVDPAKSVTAYRCQIPFLSLSNPKQNFIKVQRVATPYWKRSYSSGLCGLGFGFLSWEDRASNVNDPIPPETNVDYEGAKFESSIHLERGGIYEFECKAVNRAEVLVDGRKLFNLFFVRTSAHMTPETTERKTLVLGPGEHQVEVITCFQRSHSAPEVTLHLKGNPASARSLWSSFQF